MPRQAVFLQRDGEWYKGLAFSLAFHLCLFFAAWVGGNIWGARRPMPPVYTVRLFEPRVPEKAHVKRERKRASTPARRIPKPRPRKARKAPARKVARRAPARKAPSKKVVSLRPKKARKVPLPRKEVKKEPNPEAVLQGRLERIQERVREKQEEKILGERLSAIARRLEDGTGKAAQGRPAVHEGQEETLRAYCSAIYEKVREHWIFPEQLLDRKQLVCIVVVRILSDGRVEKMWFERRSGVELFDRSAMRAVEESVPFPRIPSALGIGSLEVGIRFRPGNVGE